MANDQGADLIKLQSRDLQVFSVPRHVMAQSSAIRDVTENLKNLDVIPVGTPTGDILRKVIEWCEYHAAEVAPESRELWEKEYVKVDHTTLLEILRAANYMDIPALLETCFKALRDLSEQRQNPQNLQNHHA